MQSVIILDDINGDKDAETIAFAYRGQSYQIDLGAANAAKFDKAMENFIAHARKVGGSRAARSGGQRPRTDRSQLEAERRWLREQGHQISDRGRIASHLHQLYEAAHQS